ncbi:MAG: hypothetical protein OQK12_04150, partial [Motiliproteus sp.]|nr:hypothetical protein [Motiliproteus sp.]
MASFYKRLGRFVVLSLIIGFAPPSLSSDLKRVFILHSYELEHICGLPQSLGVKRGLAEAGFDEQKLVFQSYAMDTKRVNNTPALMAEQAEIALSKIRDFQPDLLVT